MTPNQFAFYFIVFEPIAFLQRNLLLGAEEMRFNRINASLFNADPGFAQLMRDAEIGALGFYHKLIGSMDQEPGSGHLSLNRKNAFAL